MEERERPTSFSTTVPAFLGRSRPLKERQQRIVLWRERLARLLALQAVGRRLGKCLAVAAGVAFMIYLLLVRAIDYNPAEILVS
jgi:hypothetical protein